MSAALSWYDGYVAPTAGQSPAGTARPRAPIPTSVSINPEAILPLWGAGCILATTPTRSSCHWKAALRGANMNKLLVRKNFHPPILLPQIGRESVAAHYRRLNIIVERTPSWPETIVLIPVQPLLPIKSA